MPYFQSLNLLYIHVPKTGGMSIEKYLYDKCDMEANETNLYGYYYDKKNRIRVENERTLQHFTYNEIMNKFDYIPKDVKILVSVRNPFSRIISEIFWNKRTGANKNSSKEEIFQILHKYLHVDTDFIDNHKTPQYKFILIENLVTIKENIYFVRTENLEKDMHSLGFDDFHVHTNTNTSQITDYMQYFNSDSIELITNYYAADFIQFGYSTDITSTCYSSFPFQLGQQSTFFVSPTDIPVINDSSVRNDVHVTVENIISTIENAEKTIKNNIQENIQEPMYKGTIVTAFIRDINKYRSIADYIKFGEKLLEVSVPKIVFIDRSSYNEFFKDKETQFPTTKFVMFELTDMYLHDLRYLITDFNLETNNPEKDTLEYIFVQCYKTEWVRLATEMNPYNSSQFIWIDFGIYHMIKDDNVLNSQIQRMCNCEYKRLRIATCKYLDYVTPYCVYKRITWCFAGSVFGGSKTAVIEFADIVKNKIIHTIETRHSIMWELCIWDLVKHVIPDLYDCYICGHDFRILEYY